MDNHAFSQFAIGTPGYGTQDVIVDLLNSLSALKSLSEIDCEIDDEKTMIRQALNSLIQNQDMEKCSFFTIDQDDMLTNVTGMSIGESSTMTDGDVQTLRFRVGEGIIGTAALTKAIQYCRDCSQDPRFANFGHQEGNRPGCVVCVPVFTLHHALIGVLNVSHPVANFFTDWHLRLLNLFVNVLGQLVTNRRLFLQMESMIGERTRELKQLVDETRQLKDHYASMSMLDQLTGLHNRRYFYDHVSLAVAHHRRYRQHFCVLVVDIDHFKAINDSYGHLFGDQVLIGVAQAMKQQVRETDILVRFGGEEFVIIYTNTDKDQGLLLAERVRQEIKSLSWQYQQKTIQVTVSIGIYCPVHGKGGFDDQNIDIDQIIHFADNACYAAKTGGRDRISVFDDQQIEPFRLFADHQED